MAANAPAILIPRHIDSLPRPLVRILTAAVLLTHAVLIILLLRNLPLAEVGGGGGSSGSTLYVSVRQGQLAAHSGTENTAVATTASQQAAPEKGGRENGLITTTSAADRSAPAGKTMTKEVARQTDKIDTVTHGQKAAESAATAAPLAGGSHETGEDPGSRSGNSGAGVGISSGEGHSEGHSEGSGEGSGHGNGMGKAGPGSGPARSVSLSQLNYKRAVKPDYPERAISRNETGEVSVRIMVGTDGRVHDARIIDSSGYRLLDQAALKAARRSTFHPYTEYGRTVRAMAVIPYQFHLQDR